MPQKGTVWGDFVSELGEQGKKVLTETGKELAKTAAPVDILEGLAPINPPEVAEKTQQYKAQDAAKLAKIRSGIAMQQEMAAPPEPPKAQQSADPAERAQGPGPLMKRDKPMEHLSVQQKRNDKLHGAG